MLSSLKCVGGLFPKLCLTLYEDLNLRRYGALFFSCFIPPSPQPNLQSIFSFLEAQTASSIQAQECKIQQLFIYSILLYKPLGGHLEKFWATEGTLSILYRNWGQLDLAKHQGLLFSTLLPNGVNLYSAGPQIGMGQLSNFHIAQSPRDQSMERRKTITISESSHKPASNLSEFLLKSLSSLDLSLSSN